MELDVLNNELQKNKLMINEIKRLLISRDSNHKITAVNTILKIVTSSHETIGLTQQLINADILELLCEASCTTNPFLLQMIYKCISKFIDNKKFFEQHHTTITFEYIIRSLYVLFKIDKEQKTFKYGLQLVSFLINRVNLLEISLNDVCNISNIVSLLRQLLHSIESPPVIFVAIEVVLTLLQSKDVQCLKESLVEITYQALPLLTDILKKEKNKQFIIITAELVTNSMRFLIQKDESCNSNNSCQKLLMELVLIMKDIFVPTLTETNLCEGDLEITSVVLNGLLSIYYSPEEQVIVEFSEFLIAKGILTFLPQLESQIGPDELTVIIRSIVYEVLVHLGQELLGDEKWKYLITPGMEALPTGSSYYTIYLNGRDIIYPLASIIFNYFYLMTFSSPVVDLQFLQNICQYVLFLDEKPSYPIMKALWFNFTVAYLCGVDQFPQSKVPMMKLIQYLSNSDINSIYTHHPAILYWAFSDNAIPQELQAHVVVLWVDKSDSQSISELHSVLKMNKGSCLMIMEIMTQCETKISLRIQNILSRILEENESVWKQLCEHAWSILPTSLAKYSSNPEVLYCESKNTFSINLIPGSDESVANLMKYCWEFIPPTLEQTLIMRISCLLPGAFTKHFNLAYHPLVEDALILNTQQENTVINSFNLASSLLSAGKDGQDKRVAVTLLGHEEFLKCVEYFLAARNENVTTAIMNLLTLLLLNQKKSNYWCSKVIQLEGIKLIKFLQCGTQLSVTVLKFLAHYLEILSENLGSPVVHIPLPTALQIRALYLHIHMLCAKSEDKTARWCWSCLRRLLELSESLGLQEHLAMLPFTPTLLLKTKDSDSPTWEEVVKFLSVWFKLIPKHSPTSLTIPRAFKVIQHFSNKIDKSIYSKDLMETLKKIALLKN